MSSLDKVRVQVRPAGYCHWLILLEWRNDSETLKQSLNQELVDIESHKRWFKSILNSDKSKIYIGYTADDEPVGMVRLDFNQSSEWVMSWNVAPVWRGKGVGKEMVRLVAESYKEPLKALIKKSNIGSIKVAEYAGLRLLKEEHGFYIYVGPKFRSQTLKNLKV
ncbi:MAG: GNAT family N-acetyltransferase [Oligoflexus sp.]